MTRTTLDAAAKSRAILVTFLKYGLGLGLLAYVIYRNWGPGPNDEPGLADVLQRPIRWEPLLIAALVSAASLLLSFVRWYVLVRAQDLPFTLPNAVRLGLLGYFWNTFFPGSVGGDAVKAFCLAREQNRRTAAVATVLLDRAIGLWALFWFVALLGSSFWLAGDPALHAREELQIIVLGALGLVAFTSVLWTVLVLLPQRRVDRFAGRLSLLPKIGGMASEFWRAVSMYRSRQGALLVALLMALVGHVGWVTVFYFCAQVFQPVGDMGQIPSLTEHFVIVPIGMTIQALFPTPGGVGGGEYGFGALYALIGKPEVNGVIGSLAQRIITWALALIGYVVFLLMPKMDTAVTLAPVAEEEPVAELPVGARVQPSVSAE